MQSSLRKGSSSASIENFSRVHPRDGASTGVRIHFVSSGDPDRIGNAGVAIVDETLRAQKRVSDPSLLDLLATTSLPDVMPLDLRLVMRITHIGARRKHGRTTDGLEDELEHLVAAAGQAEAWALTAAAFYEARWNASRKPQRALGYVQKAASLRPQATGYEGLPFPPSLDATWRLTLELSIYGIRSEADVEQWLQALSAIPQHARETVLADEMNCLTIANRLWIIEAGKNPEQRDWKSVDRASQAIERWSEANGAAVLFAAARRARVVVRGEYEHQLQDAVKMASQVPAFVTADLRAAFILDEIVASQFVYARKYAKADVAFRIALDRAPADSSLLSRTYLKAAQAAGALGRDEAAVELTTSAITAMESDPYRTHTDRPLAHAELALAQGSMATGMRPSRRGIVPVKSYSRRSDRMSSGMASSFASTTSAATSPRFFIKEVHLPTTAEGTASSSRNRAHS